MENRTCENCKYCKHHYAFDSCNHLIKINCSHCTARRSYKKIDAELCTLYEEGDNNNLSKLTFMDIYNSYLRLNKRVEDVCKYLKNLSDCN